MKEALWKGEGKFQDALGLVATVTCVDQRRAFWIEVRVGTPLWPLLQFLA